MFVVIIIVRELIADGRFNADIGPIFIYGVGSNDKIEVESKIVKV